MTQTYEAKLSGGMTRTFTRHATKAAARATIHAVAHGRAAGAEIVLSPPCEGDGKRGKRR